MSDFAKTDLTCPKCKTGFPITYWTSVNVTLDPHLRECVFSGDIHQYSCPQCGQGVVIQTPLLYHDATRRFMIYFVAERPDKPITWNTKFLEDTARTLPKYQFRFVTSWDDLIEKVTIFENGWDDTIIEMLKLFVTEKVFPFGSPEFADCTVLLAGRQEKPQEPVLAFEILRGGRTFGTGNAPFELYENLAKGQEERSGKNIEAGEWKMVNKATILASRK